MSSLPAPLSSFVGRETEIAQVTHLLGTTRLLTLTGPGGVGKTRLALAVAASVADAFCDGVTFVSLAPIRDASLVTATIAGSFGVIEQPGVPLLEGLTARLREQQVLLVLDNFEQVIEAAPSVAELLRVCGQLCILVTSRVSLHLTGEYEYPVPSLALPVTQVATLEHLAEYEAVELFIQRARAVSPDYALTNDNALTTVEICRRLDGLPLAIELAAVRMKALTPQIVLARLDRSMSLLAGGPRDQPVRQQTMRDTIAWSYDLLDPAEQALFRRTSIFAGGWTLKAAEAVCGPWKAGAEDLLDGLISLVDKSLIVPRAPATGEPEDAPRFGMLQTIREFGQEQLVLHDELIETARRHASYFLDYIRRILNEANGTPNDTHVDRSGAELDNVRTALAWAVRHDAETALQLNRAFVAYWLYRGQISEGRQWFETALANAEGVTDSTRATALAYTAFLATTQGDYDVARSLCEEALAISERAEYLLGQAESLFSLGRIAMYQDEREQAHQFYSAALRLVHGMNSIVWLPSLLGNLASVCVDQGDFATARMYLQSALDIARSRNDLPNIAMTLSNLAYISLVQSDWNSARRLLSESLRLRYECYDRRLVAHSLEYCAWIAGMSQQPTRAARILGAVDAIRSEIEVPVPPVILQDYDRFVPLARSQLAPPAWDRAWAEGCAMSLEQALSYALELPEEAESDAMDSPTPHDDTIAGLSKRELEVLRLLVDGCSNKEIATRLYVSQHTVASHVAHVLNKLGVESRTAAATWAMRQGII